MANSECRIGENFALLSTHITREPAASNSHPFYNNYILMNTPKFVYIISQHVSALYSHRQVKYLHSLSTTLLLSLTLANVYIWRQAYVIFAPVDSNV